MKILDLVSLSTRMFKTRPLRTFLTVLGVGVGIGTVLFLVSLGYGLQRVILDKITTADSLLSLDVSPGTSGLISLDKNSIDEISAMENVAEVSSLVSMSAQMTMGGLTGDGLIFAVNPSFFRLGGIIPSFGEAFQTENGNEVIMSSAGVKLFNMNPSEAVGKEIQLVLFNPKIDDEGFENIEIIKRDQSFVIKGVVDDENTSFVYLPMGVISDLTIEQYSQVKVKVEENEDMEAVRNQIIDKGFLVSSLSEIIDQANKIFRIIQIVLALFGLVALIVSAIGMFNTMTIALLERINEIGIMRSIGASSGDIRMMFLVESVLMGLLGGVGGVIIGYLAGELANIGINFLAKNFGGQVLHLFYRPLWFIGVIIFFSTFIGFLTGVYPSRRASKLNPLEALRYK